MARPHVPGAGITGAQGSFGNDRAPIAEAGPDVQRARTRKRLFAQVPIRAAGDRALQTTALRVLIAICGYANDGQAWPSLPTISDATCIDSRNLPAAIAALERAGYLRRDGWHRNRNGRSRTYRIIYEPQTSCPDMTSDEAVNSCGHMTTEADPTSCGGMTSCGDMTSCPDMKGVMPGHELEGPQVMPGHDQTDHKSTDQGTDQGTDTLPISTPDDVQQAVALWNETAEAHGLSQVQRLTPTRRSALRVRLKECGGIPGWRDALDKLKASPFLLGGGTSGWKADFDFVVKAKSFTKLMEDGYAPRQPLAKPTSNVNSGGLMGAAMRRYGPNGEPSNV